MQFVLRHTSRIQLHQFCSTTKYLSRQISTIMSDAYQNNLQRFLSVVPVLDGSKHKGSAGRIGVVGGSLEYTGAPYFAAISALKVGADLVHVFCASLAGPVIKSYSPELIVHPVLDETNGVALIEPWLERLHVLVIGPGLGRDESTLNAISTLVSICKHLNKPLVLDADGLFWAAQNIELLKNYPGLIMTPNAVEFERLFGDSPATKIRLLGSEAIILQKGLTDKVWTSGTDEVIEANTPGSFRRCGGQGDLLCGVVATFYCWGLMAKLPIDEAARVACCAGSFLAKECSRSAFQRKGRSMLASDMIEEIGQVFVRHFEKRQV